jgi:hypothetical protein
MWTIVTIRFLELVQQAAAAAAMKEVSSGGEKAPISSWNKRCNEYIKVKEIMDRKITSQDYGNYDDDGLGLSESES